MRLINPEPFTYLSLRDTLRRKIANLAYIFLGQFCHWVTLAIGELLAVSQELFVRVFLIVSEVEMIGFNTQFIVAGMKDIVIARIYAGIEKIRDSVRGVCLAPEIKITIPTWGVRATPQQAITDLLGVMNEASNRSPGKGRHRFLSTPAVGRDLSLSTFDARAPSTFGRVDFTFTPQGFERIGVYQPVFTLPVTDGFRFELALMDKLNNKRDRYIKDYGSFTSGCVHGFISLTHIISLVIAYYQAIGAALHLALKLRDK